jgi:hypothetical protein
MANSENIFFKNTFELNWNHEFEKLSNLFLIFLFEQSTNKLFLAIVKIFFMECKNVTLRHS